MSVDPADWLFPSPCHYLAVPRNDVTPARTFGQRAIPFGPLPSPSRTSASLYTRSTQSLALDANALEESQDLFSLEINGIALKMLHEVPCLTLNS